MPIMIFSPFANFGNQSLCIVLKPLQNKKGQKNLEAALVYKWINVNGCTSWKRIAKKKIGNSHNIDPNLRNLWMVPDAFCFFILKFISQEFNARFELLYRVHQQVLIDQNTNFFFAKSWSLLIEFFPWFVEMFYKITPILSLKLVKCCMS